jgi:hypothetical protein
MSILVGGRSRTLNLKCLCSWNRLDSVFQHFEFAIQQFHDLSTGPPEYSARQEMCT